MAANDSIFITDAWTRASLSKSVHNAAVYLTITNKSDTADSITSVKSDIADILEVHEMTFNDGIMRMGPVENLNIPPNQDTKLTPNGYHLMLLGLKEPLKAGSMFNLIISFKEAGCIPVAVEVRPVYTKK